MNSILLLILSSVLLSHSLCDGSCSNVKACTAKCGGKSYDVSKLIDNKQISDGVTDPNKHYEYKFSCGGMSCNSQDNVAVCQEKDGDDGKIRQWNIGLTSSTQWTIIKNSPLTIQIQYNDGEKDTNQKIRSTSVTITVGNASAFNFIKEDTDNAIYEFMVSTPSTKDVYASSAGIPPGIIGWVLIGVFLIGIAAYFIVGSILMVTIKGARGVEIIPNYMFWKSFPFLLRDGMLFMISPCYKRSEYQSI